MELPELPHVSDSHQESETLLATGLESTRQIVSLISRTSAQWVDYLSTFFAVQNKDINKFARKS